MIQWKDQGIIVATKTHGETGAILSILTENNGLYRGYFQGGQSRKNVAMIQIGNQVSVEWKSRLLNQLGNFKCEPIYQTTAFILKDYQALCAIQSAAYLVDQLLPERSPLSHIYHGFEILIKHMHQEGWPILYVKWELELLKALGFGLDLSRCAVTGRFDDLVAVSPNTGRAVCSEVAKFYGNKLYPLPAFLLGKAFCEEDLEDGLNLTGAFLEKCLLHPLHKTLPEIRNQIL